MSDMPCPDRQRLQDYSDGKLGDEESELLAEHTNTCATCQEVLGTLENPADPLIARLRRPHVPDPYQQEPGYKEALARARAAVQAVVSGEDVPDESPPVQVSQLREIGDYRLLGKLGQGGMGTVYRALQVKLEKTVALKILPPGHTQDPRALARFEREMKAVGRLNHPNIVQALDARDIEGTSILVMEYVEGDNLAQVVRHNGPLRVPDACELVRQAAVGLQYVHENGLVHRDIKPSNLMLSAPLARSGRGAGGEGSPQPQVKILDLGLALLRTGVSGKEMTGSEQAMGTADYIAPEQVQDAHHVDIRADIYSLGCTLYKLLAGRTPFSGPSCHSTFDKMLAHVQRPVPPIRELRPEVPPELAAVLDRMLAKSPDDRYAKPGDVARAIARFTVGSNLLALMGVSKRDATLAQGGVQSDTALAATDPFASSALAGTEPAPVGQVSNLPASPLARAAGEERISPLARGAGEGQGVRASRIRRRLAIGLALLGIAILLGVIIHYRDRFGRDYSLTVPDGSEVTIREDGSAEVKPGGSGQVSPLPPGEGQGEGGPESDLWKRGPSDNPWNNQGLVARPAQLPGVKRWQVNTVNARGSIRQGGGLAWSPDGRLLASCADRAVRVYRTDDWRLVRLFCHYAERVSFSPDGRWLATAERAAGTTPPAVRLWDMLTGRSGPVLEGGAWWIAWSPDGNRLVTANCSASKISVWSADGKRLRTWDSGFVLSHHAAWSPDGQWIAVGGNYNEKPGRTLKVWRADGTAVPMPDVKDSLRTLCVGWSPDGRWLAARESSGDAGQPGAGALKVYDTSTWKCTSVPEAATWVADLTWSPDSRFVCYSESGAGAKILDTHNKAVRSIVERVLAVSWNPQGTWIALGLDDSRIRLWDPIHEKQGPEIGSLMPIEPDERRVWPSSDRRWLATYISGTDKEIRLLSDDGRPGPLLRSTPAVPVFSVAWKPDGSRLASGMYDGRILLWAPDKPDPVATMKVETAVRALDWSPDGKMLLSANDQKVRLWDAENENLLDVPAEHAASLGQVAWSPDGKHFASVSRDPRDNKVRLWSADGHPGPILAEHKQSWGVSWSPDSKQIGTWGRTQGKWSARFWNAADGKPGAKFATRIDFVRSFDWSPDGKSIAVRGPDKRCCVWDRDATTPPQLESAYVTPARWSPNGKRVATWDAYIYGGNVFNVGQSEPVATLDGHTEPWLDHFWSPDSRQVISASHDRTLRRWNAMDGQCLSTTLLLPNGEVAYFSQGGKLETTSAEVEKQLVYVVEQDDGEHKLYTPAEFRALVEANVKKQAAAGSKSPHPNPLPKGEGTKNSPLPSDGRGAGGEGVSQEPLWRPGRPDNPWNGLGLVPQPAAFPGIKRWQVETIMPRGAGVNGRQLCWSPDARLLACCNDRAVRVYRTDDWRLVRLFAHSAFHAAFSPDGKWLASASGYPCYGERAWADNAIRLWDVAAGRAGPVLRGHQSTVASLAWSPDGKALISGGDWGDFTLRLWTLDGKCLRAWPSGFKAVYSVVWSPDGSLLAAGGTPEGRSGQAANIWRANGDPGPVIDSADLAVVHGMAWSRDGRWLAAACSDFGKPGLVRVWDTATWKPVPLTVSPPGLAYDLSWSPEGNRFAWVGEAASGGVVSMQDKSNRALPLPWTRAYLSVAWSPKGDRVAVGDADGVVQIWDPARDQTTQVLGRREPAVLACAASPDGNWLAAYRHPEKDVCLWPPEGGPPRVLRRRAPPIKCFAWCPHGSRLAAGYEDGGINVWHVIHANERVVLKGHTGEVHCLDWSPDGRRLLSGSADQTVRVWDAADGGLREILTGQAAPVKQVSWSPDGKHLAARSEDPKDNKVRIWSAEGRPGPILQGLLGSVLAVRWSPDSRQILTWSADDRAARVWSAADGKPALQLPSQSKLISEAAWSPDGRWIAAAGFPFRVWKADGTAGPDFSGSLESNRVLWSPDSRWVACWMWNLSSAVPVFSPLQAEPVSILAGHTASLRYCYWSADSRQLIAVSWDKSMRRWNALTGQGLSTRLILPDGQSAYFTQGGKLETTSPEVEKQLVYVVEQDDGEHKLYTPAEFRALVEANVKKQAAAGSKSPHPNPLPKGEGTKSGRADRAKRGPP